MDSAEARQILDLTMDSPTEEEVHRAYKRAALRYHPDKNGDDSTMFIRVRDAYDHLLAGFNPNNPNNQGFGDDVMFAEFMADVGRAFMNLTTRFTVPVTVEDILNHTPQLVTLPSGETLPLSFTRPDETFLIPTDFGNLEIGAKIVPGSTKEKGLRFVAPNHLEMRVSIPVTDLIYGTILPVRIPGRRTRRFEANIKPARTIRDRMCFRFSGGGLTSSSGTGDLIVRVRVTFPFDPQAAHRHRDALTEVFSSKPCAGT